MLLGQWGGYSPFISTCGIYICIPLRLSSDRNLAPKTGLGCPRAQDTIRGSVKTELFRQLDPLAARASRVLNTLEICLPRQNLILLRTVPAVVDINDKMNSNGFCKYYLFIELR